jgi:hypothetical protein
MTSSKQKVIFIHIPKTAGYSIGRCLKKAKALKKGYGFSHTYIRHILKKEDSHLPIMAVVRNPYDRLWSIFSFYRNSYRQCPNRGEVKMKNTIPESITFKQFVMDTPTVLADAGLPEFVNCYNYLTDTSNNIVATDILKFENLESDYDDFCEKYKIKNNLIKMNGNPNKPKVNKSLLYDDEMKKAVEGVFGNDLKHFNYTYKKFLKELPVDNSLRGGIYNICT